MVPQLCLIKGLRLSLHSSAPGVLGSSSFSLSFWCPMEGYVCDVVEFSSEHIPDPSPSPSHENGVHALLMTLRK